MRTLAIFFSVPMLLLACDDSGDGGSRIGASDPQASQLPQVQVKLPPPPSFKKEHAPEKYPDLSVSIYGLRKNMKATLNKQVKVKGFIIEVYDCPTCPKGADCPPCQKPHFWLSDRANGKKDKAMMVTDYPHKDEKRRKIKFDVGAQYYVTGTFVKSSATGFSSSEGLVVYAGAEPVAAAQ